MPWKKLGRVFDPRGRSEWMHSHAQLPVALSLGGGLHRVYFAARTREQRSHVGWVEIDLAEPTKVLRVSEEPVLEPGPIGFFDEHGVFPSSFVRDGDRILLYYIGWNQGVRPPLFYASIGLATSEDGGRTFRRMSTAPILSRSEHDPCLVTSPHVFLEGGLWRMTYVSGIRWEEVGGSLKSYYHIKSAESDDGVRWRREGRVAIDFATGDETNIARSWVVRDGSLYRMWFSYVRGETPYRIGYAESRDFLTWQREDGREGLDVSPDGFDSEMVCYPNVVDHGGRRYMLYNGNRFGHSGFGVALHEDRA